LAVGTKLDVHFRLPGTDQGLQVVGQVVREEAVRRVGIKFQVLRGDARERIRSFVDADRRGVRPEQPAAIVPTDSAEREEWEAELRASEARKTAILEAALDCLITIDQEGNILDFNQAAERTFGYLRGEVVGRKMVDLIIPQRLREQHRRGFARYLATGEG